MLARTSFALCLVATAFAPAGVLAQASGPARADTSATVRGRPTATVGGEVRVSAQPPARVPSNTAGEFRPLDREEMQMAAAGRGGEYDAAPWIDRAGGPAGAGRILRSTNLPGVAMRPEERTFFQLHEQLYVAVPAGMMARPGDYYMAVSLGSGIGVDAQVVQPTALLRVEQESPAGEAAVARVMHQFAPLRPSDMLVPYEGATPRAGTPATFSGGATGTIAWVENRSVLPSLQAYAIVDIGSEQGVQTGDVITVFRAREQHGDGTWLPEKEIAKGRVLRVNARGSSVLIFDQTEPAIGVGAAVRLTARTR